MIAKGSGYRREDSRAHPPHAHASYVSTQKRAPLNAPIRFEATFSEITGPRPPTDAIGASEADLTYFAGGAAIGERIIITGCVLDEDGNPIRDTLIEVWQANAAGRYAHDADRHDAPLDPHFSGIGRVVSDRAGVYRFVTVKPGAYPWANHHNGWRPQHIHFSLFGPGFATRLITQMYFPGDPLLALDPIFHSIADEHARARLVASFDLGATEPNHALGYRFDIVLRGRIATPMEP